MRSIMMLVLSSWFICGIIIEPAVAEKGFMLREHQLNPSSQGIGNGSETGLSTSVDVSGWQFFDLEGDADNQVIMLDIGTPLGLSGMDIEVNGIGWDLSLSTVGFSWGSEATIAFDWNGDLVNDVFLTPSLTDDPVTMEFLSSGGNPLKLSSLNIPNGIVPGGLLRIELFETFDDNPNAVDAFLDSGTLTIQIEPVVTNNGDFNGDGLYDCLDIDSLVVEIAAGSNNLAFDLTGDGQVNLLDRDAWLAEAGAVNLPSGNPYLPADFTLDGIVDGLDFVRWNENKFTSTAAFCLGDATAEGIIDGLDFVEWNLYKFMSSDATSAVPEPTVCGGLLALIGLGLRRKCWSCSIPSR